MSIKKKEVFNRVDDFIKFHEQSSLVDTIVIPFKKYCELANYTKEEKENAVLLYSLTYSVPSTIICMNKIQEIIKTPDLFWKENKNKLIFQSDRKYIKINDKFIKTFMEFDKNIFTEFEKMEVLDVEKAIYLIQKNYFFARFSAFLFLETYCCLFDKRIINNKLDWKNGTTVTSGMLNVLGLDNLANIWDKTHKIDIDFKLLDIAINILLKKVKIGQNISIMETTLCAYRKLFKGSRYLGYYTDRVLEELNKIIENYPEYIEQLSILFIAREQTIPSKFLGEKHNWNGIRKDLKKFYIRKGYWKW